MLKKFFPRWYFVFLVWPYILYGLSVYVVYLFNDGYMAGGSGGFEASGFVAWFVPLTVGLATYTVVHGYIITSYGKRHGLTRIKK